MYGTDRALRVDVRERCELEQMYCIKWEPHLKKPGKIQANVRIFEEVSGDDSVTTNNIHQVSIFSPEQVKQPPSQTLFMSKK